MKLLKFVFRLTLEAVALISIVVAAFMISVSLGTLILGIVAGLVAMSLQTDEEVDNAS